MVDNKTINTLEFDKILQLLSEFTVSSPTKEAVLSMLPDNDINAVNKLLDTTQEMYDTVNKYNVNPISPFDDCIESIKKASAGAILQMGELLKIRRLIKSGRVAKSSIDSLLSDIVNLKEIVAPLFIDVTLEKIIGDSIASESEMKDTASDKLKLLRRQILSADTKLKDKLASYTKSSSYSKYLQDNLVTIRGGRFVLPVKAECKSSIPGLIHDQSSSGATVFIEPMEVVTLNNELKSLQLEEAREIERILIFLSALVSESSASLLKCQEVCTMLDIIHAKMTFSVSINANRPTLNNKGNIDIVCGRHPLIDKNSVVPIDISLGQKSKLLLISGPNTGGKTVCLKTVGLFCLMACVGVFVPSNAGTELSVFDNIFCSIGDDQSILNSLSTFSSHIINITHITDNITNNSLVLFDELGGGTDPSEGSALAIGIIKYLELMKTSGIITTHYSELKEYAILSDSIENACMQFDEKTLKPTYKLLKGLPGVSNALNISKTLGLNDYILKNAYEVLDDSKKQFEKILQVAEQVKADAIREKENVEKLSKDIQIQHKELVAEREILKQKIERVNDVAKQEARRKISGLMDNANELIENMAKLVKNADEKSLLEAKKMRNKLDELQYSTLISEEAKVVKELDYNLLKVGDEVYVQKLNSNATIVSLANKRGEITVLAGYTQLRVSKDEIFAVDMSTKAVKTQETKTRNSSKKVSKNNNVNKFLTQNSSADDEHDNSPKLTEEIKVLGLTIAEAIEIIEPIIVFGIPKNTVLKVVHGKGTGALGRGLQQYFKKQKCVKEVRYGGYGEGDSGVTMVTFK